MLTYEVHLFLKIKLKEKNHIKWGGGGGVITMMFYFFHLPEFVKYF